MNLAHLDAGTVAAWIALVVAVALGARGGIQRSTIGALKEQNDAYESREIQHQKDAKEAAARHSQELSGVKVALRRLGARNDYLEELVLRKSEIETLVSVVRDHDVEAATRHTALLAVMTSMQSAQKNRAEQESALVAGLLAVSSQLENFRVDGGT